MKTFVISLARTPDRLARFRKLNGDLVDAEHFAAVDGSRLSMETLVTQGRSDRSVSYTRGARRQRLVASDLWEHVRNTAQAATICEDDAILHSAFRSKTAELLAAPASWDIVLWGWNFDSLLSAALLPNLSDCTLVFNQDALRRNALEWRKREVTPQLFRLHRALGTCCYSISPRGAERLLKYATPVRETQVYFPLMNRIVPNSTLDIMLNGAYSALDSYVSFPPLAVTYNDHAASTVFETSASAGLKGQRRAEKAFIRSERCSRKMSRRRDFMQTIVATKQDVEIFDGLHETILQGDSRLP